MPKAAKITDEQLRAALARGMTQKQIAAEYRVDIATVSRRVAKLKAAAADIAVEVLETTGTLMPVPIGKRRPEPRSTSRPAADGTPAEVGEISLWDTKRALDDNYASVKELLNPAKHHSDTKTKLRIRGELRAHIAEGVRILETIYAVQEMRAFQAAVMKVLDECEPGTRDRLVAALLEGRALRRTVQLD